MVDNILHLIQVVIRIYPHNGPAKCLGSQFRVKAFRPVVSYIRKFVITLETELVETQGKIPHVFIIAPPGDRLPDAEFLLPDGYFFVAKPEGIFSK